VSFSIPLFCAVGLIFIALAVPLIRRRVRPNALYGLRVPATYADESVWYEANERSGRDLAALGLITIALALLLPLFLAEPAYSLSMTVILLVGVMGLGIRGWRTANRLLELRRR
jgi:uncharacterized membrane protein